MTTLLPGPVAQHMGSFLWKILLVGQGSLSQVGFSYSSGSIAAGLDKIKTFRDRSLNLSKLSVKVRRLRQQNLRQKV